MVGLENNIREYAEEYLKDSDCFVVDVVRGAANKKTKISVFIDSDTSVSIDVCANVSKYVSLKVEEDLGYEDPYIIEVSSSGLDRPLSLKRQYIKNIGRNVEVILNEGVKIIGKLEEVMEEGIKIVSQKTKKKPSEELVINNSNIKSTKVIISF